MSPTEPNWDAYAQRLRELETAAVEDAGERAGDDARRAIGLREQNNLLHRLEGQRHDLDRVGRELRLTPSWPEPPPVEVADWAEALVAAEQAGRLADEALQRADDAGGVARLDGWPLWLRNGLVYTVVSVALLGVFAVFTIGATAATDFRWSPLTLVSVPCCGLPLLATGLGWLLCGGLFVPRRGGPVERTPVLGLVVSLLVPWLLCGGYAAAFG
ncbi:hypothetical protein [Micromonospora sp. CPCC 205561]|uniref:hypothetical protein n=1 Tax=Micromonospora sp. CPCC 205561 TaxID=3122407 RepID=UPI002FF22A2F